MIPHTQTSAVLKTTSAHGQLYQAETFCLLQEKWRWKKRNVKKIHRLASFLSSQVAESKILEKK